MLTMFERHLFTVNSKDNIFGSNEALISVALCNSNSLKCLMGVCNGCKDLPKIDELKMSELKCSKACFQKIDSDCHDHTVKVKQFERVKYIHKGEEKKKLELVDKMLTLEELVQLLKLKMEGFPQHRFNVQHTAKTYDQLVFNLNENNLLKIHDFSENYTCLLPIEIQSLHWTQQTATVYPIVVLRKVNNKIREDHLTFLTDDKLHDVPFVEYCNKILHDHCKNEGVNMQRS